ncbi:MAG: D-TA family PLP-dependent enzyme [Planctomycetota bacterium]|nr:MAG: D-TA family PLP-dependent enzyme [Planctomycetota bacterium]
MAASPRGHTINTIPTPALVLDAEKVRRNIERMAAYTKACGIANRPHTKTHKSLAIAGLQLAAGAKGLTVAKVGEAEVFARAFGDREPDILVAYPTVDPARTIRLAALARCGTIRVAIDTPEAIAALSAAASAAGTTLGILCDLDVGSGRTGVPTTDRLVALAAATARSPGLRLDGIFYYPGHVTVLPANQGEPLAAVAAMLQEAIDAFDAQGLCREIVSGGSTPTAFQSHHIREGTEIRPGTCVYNDLNIVRGGFGSLDDCAAQVICTVVSDAVANQVILDGGSKTLTSDRCGPAPESGHGLIVEYPDAFIGKLTEEHAQVDIRRCLARPRVGERVTVIPNHICPVVNLHDTAWWWEADGSLQVLPIDARGRLS